MFLKHLLLTITSPVFSTIAVIYHEDDLHGVDCERSWPHLHKLRWQKRPRYTIRYCVRSTKCGVFSWNCACIFGTPWGSTRCER